MRPMYCPFLIVSPSRTGRSSRSPERLEESFTWVAAWSFPAAETFRVMGPFLTVEVCTVTGGSFLGTSDAAKMPTTASTKTAAMMRLVQDMGLGSFRLQRAAHGAVQVGAGDDGVDAGRQKRELGPGEVLQRVADLDLGPRAGVVAPLGELQALLGGLEVLLGETRRGGEGDV